MKNLVFIIILSFVTNLMGQTNNCNCCSEKYSEFDFWLGSWSVTNPKGELVGKNVIDKIQNNCILRENWTSAKGKYTGTSSNFYNSKTGQWEQIWIDNQGGSLHLKGNRVDNQMILQSEKTLNKNGDPFIQRITWTLNKDGSVRQLWETITNETEIAIAFDGLYRKE